MEPPTITILQDRRAIEALLPAWNTLAAEDALASPFGRGDVSMALWQTFAPTLRPVVVIGTSGTRLVGILPLAFDRRRVGPMSLRVLGPLARWHGQQFDIVAAADAPPELPTRLLSALEGAMGDHDAVALQRVPRGARLLTVAQGVAPEDSRRVVLGAEGPIRQGRTAKNLRRTARRTAEAFPDLRVEHVHPSAEIPERLRAFAALHADRWAGSATPSALADPATATRFVSAFRPLVEEGIMRLHLMRGGGSLLAGLCTFAGRGGTFGWRLAVSPRHPALGLGIQLCHEVMSWCAAAGDRWYDLGVGRHAYKALWQGEAIPHYRIRLAGLGWRWRALRGLGAVTGRRWVAGFLGAGGGAGTPPAPDPSNLPRHEGRGRDD